MKAIENLKKEIAPLENALSTIAAFFKVDVSKFELHADTSISVYAIIGKKITLHEYYVMICTQAGKAPNIFWFREHAHFADYKDSPFKWAKICADTLKNSKLYTLIYYEKTNRETPCHCFYVYAKSVMYVRLKFAASIGYAVKEYTDDNTPKTESIDEGSVEIKEGIIEI